MRHRRHATIEDLRTAIDCLPRETRIAMLQGIQTNEIIVGAYTDGGGICPMLAAHRNGGRTNFITFARAWDRFAFRDSRVRYARRATERELLVLKSHLEASLLGEEGPASDLAAAIAEHRSLRDARERDHHEAPPAQERRRDRIRPGDPDRRRELRKRPGWRWMRIVRSYDEYERLLDALEDEHEVVRAGEREHQLVN